MARNLKLMTEDQLKQLDLNGSVKCRSNSLKHLSQIVDTGYTFPVDEIVVTDDAELTIKSERPAQFPNFIEQLKSIMKFMPDHVTKAQFQQVIDSDSVELFHKFAEGLDTFTKEEVWASFVD